MAFWLAVVILLLPSAAFRPVTPQPQTGVQSLSTRTAGVAARQSCPRQLDACCDGLQAFAKLCQDVHRFLSEWGAQGESKPAADPTNPDQHTLTTADLLAPWHGPAPRRETGVIPAAIR
jgi:hypothetical protein